MSEEPISARRAKSEFGIFTRHGKMQNGELRFRLINETGGGYIRTVSTSESGWQKAHSHKSITEVYVVERGWMGYCELVNDKLVVSAFQAGQVIATKAQVPHNVYLPDDCVIHTVKLFSAAPSDWKKHDVLTAQSSALSEEDILELSALEQPTYKMDGDVLLKPLMDHYINLDRLIWGIPAFLFAGTSVTVGLVASKISDLTENEGTIGILLLAFLFSSLMNFLGFYSMHRISYHHRLIGAEIYEISGLPYFESREIQFQSKPWRSAHFVLKYVMLVLSGLFLALMCLEVWQPRSLNPFLFGQESANEGSSAQARSKLEQPNNDQITPLHPNIVVELQDKNAALEDATPK